jgi:hypothetical protein
MYTIDKNVPLPTSGKGFKSKREIIRETLELLEVGESFVIPSKDLQTYYHAKKLIDNDNVFTIRSINLIEYRIFRLK